jgi:hypothetical protein
MVRSNFGLKAFGLCALIFGLLTITANAAHAEAGGEWLLGGSSLTSYPAGLEPTIEGTLENAMGALLTEILKKTVRYLCTAVTLNGVRLQSFGKLRPGFMVRATGCKTFLGKLNANKEVVEESESVACEPFTGTEKGVITSNKLKGLLALDANHETDVLIEPEVAGQPLVTVNQGSSCAIGEEVLLFGKIYLKDCGKEALVDKEVHLIEEDTTLSKLWVISDTEEHLQTKLDGSVLTMPGGEHHHMTFAGHAN